MENVERVANLAAWYIGATILLLIVVVISCGILIDTYRIRKRTYLFQIWETRQFIKRLQKMNYAINYEKYYGIFQFNKRYASHIGLERMYDALYIHRYKWDIPY